MKIYEIISPKDKLDDSLEMIKGGVSSELRLCMKGCHTGELKPKPSDPTIPAEPKPKDDTADTTTINTNDGVISSSNLYPKVDCNSCTCTDMSAYVIDPNGYIYKCWADVGIKKRAVGNLDEGLKNFDIISEFVQGSDKFSDPKCNNCRYMPICDGGCNLYRVKSKRNGIPYEVCQYDDQGMQAFLEEFTLNNTRL